MLRIFILLLLGVSLMNAQRIDITPDELENLQRQGVAVVDIRTAPEWFQSGVIPESKLLTFFDARGNYDALGFLQNLKRQGITPETPVILVCRSGNRTLSISNFLISQGFEKVYNLKHGILEWLKLTKPTQTPVLPSSKE